MTATTIEVVGAVLGSGVLGGAIGKLVEWQKTKDERSKTQETLAQTFAATLMAERKSLAEELADERKATDTSREKHADCMQLVGEMAGRIEEAEVRLNRAEVSLQDCQGAHQAAASDARALRERVASLERKASDPSIPAVVRR
jgi:chromosome segregation ATPase